MANPMLTALHKLGMDDLDRFGDSTNEFALDYTGPTAEEQTRG
jgi:hypothetical protein